MRTRGPRLCKFGGARMAHTAKDRVTNQEFPSCHSWERKRRQKLRIKLFSSQKKRRKGAPLLQTFVKDAHVSARVEDISDGEGSCFMIFRLFFFCQRDFWCCVWTRLLDSGHRKVSEEKRRSPGEQLSAAFLWFAPFGLITFSSYKSGIPAAGHFPFLHRPL